MSVLTNAHDFVISVNELVNIQNTHHHGPTGIDILLAASTPDTAVDSEGRQYAPSCFPGTREQYINDITNWAITSTTDQSPSIYWMRGPAGVGKSALAQTCAEKLKETGQLGATFFFSVNSRDDHKRLFTTLAYQLSTHSQDYRQILNDTIQNDKTLVTKTMQSQFEGLIAKPLQELENQGKGVRRRVIFIDGLDECASKDAQEEIIKIIATSVHSKPTLLRWAIFSRPEPQITTTFDDEYISVVSHCVELPISRDVDQEIELYLRSTFKNMLHRRKLLHLVPTWPTNQDIKMLVAVSAGLFAYPAAVLRFIDQNSCSGFMERLQVVLDAILQPNVQRPVSPFAVLDAFYFLVMTRVPKDVLSSVQLFLACGIFGGFGRISVAVYCNALRLTQADFVGMINALQSVMSFEEPAGPPTFDRNIDIKRSYFDQDPRAEVERECWRVHGRIDFYHKSFYDFLIDHARSSSFCVATPAVDEKLFDFYIQQHHHYAQAYAIQGTKLVLAPCVSSSSMSLSWPQGSEFVDSYLKLGAFYSVSRRLLLAIFSASQGDVSQNSLKKFADFDYRKCMSAVGSFGFSVDHITGFDILGTVKWIDGSEFKCIAGEDYNAFNSIAFLKMVKKLVDFGIIRPYHHRLPSVLTPVYQTLSRLIPSGRSYGQYKLGHGEKSVIWYWEFDTDKRYFHEFKTVDFLKSRRIYDAEKFRMWDDDFWVPPTSAVTTCQPVIIVDD